MPSLKSPYDGQTIAPWAKVLNHFCCNFEITWLDNFIPCFYLFYLEKRKIVYESNQFENKSKMLQPEEALAKALDNLSSEDWEKNVEGETLL